MKVISNIILFVYSLRGALIKIARGCHTWLRNYFDGTTPYIIVSLPRRYLVEFSYHDYSKLTAIGTRLGQYLTHALSYITRKLA